GRDPLPRDAAGRAPALDTEFDESSGRLQLAATDATVQDGASSIPPRGGRAHLMSILELLARVEAVNVPSFAAWVPRACLHLSWGVPVPVITPRADEETCQALHQLVRAGLNPVLIVITPAANFGALRDRAQRLGYVAYHIHEKKDLDIWQQRKPFKVPS